jgi:hypothetical protein
MISESEQEFQMKCQDGLSNNNNTISLTSALRSRAIAIRPTKICHPEDLEEQNAHQSEMIYDQATWRMYNRIVGHRKNQFQGEAQVQVTTIKRYGHYKRY